jgi:hypothetical protein
MNGYQFPAGSEFRVDWTISRPNTNWRPFSTNPRYRNQTIETAHTSRIMETLGEAINHAEYIATFSTPSIKVKTPGSKRFIPAVYARKEWVA